MTRKTLEFPFYCWKRVQNNMGRLNDMKITLHNALHIIGGHKMYILFNNTVYMFLSPEVCLDIKCSYRVSPFHLLAKINFPLFQPTSLVAQMVKHLSTMQETQVRAQGWEDPLEKVKQKGSFSRDFIGPRKGLVWMIFGVHVKVGTF